LVQCPAQSFRIESFQLDAQSRPSLIVPVDTNSYYRLLSGEGISNLHTVVALSFSNTIVAPQPATNGQAFYRVQRVPLASPLDSDGDGIDDVWEFEHGLDPLGNEAAQVAPGDTNTWLEIYLAQEAVTFDYQYAPGQISEAYALAQDPVGKAVYVAGIAAGNDGTGHGLILESTDGGINWSTNPPMEYYAPGSFRALTLDSSGSLYAAGAGSAYDESIVLKRSVGGTNWSLADSYSGEPDWGASGTVTASFSAAAADRNGNVYVAGQGNGQVNGTLKWYWFVRKFTATNNSWATVNVFRGSGISLWPNAVACDPSGGVFVAGTDATADVDLYNTWAWVVRHSGDGGATWQTVDTYHVGGTGENTSNVARGVAADAKGNVYVVGYGYANENDTGHWIVRASSDGGSSWRTIDDTSSLFPYVFPTGTGPEAEAITEDGAGRLDVLGSFDDSNYVEHWLVRQSSDGGATWVNADDFLYGDGSYNAVPQAILGLSDGSVLAAGSAVVPGDLQSFRWLVRRLPRPPQQ
jgi:hypothetical protein